MHLKTAFVFPGQGSQYLGMLGSLQKEHSQIVKSVFNEAAETLHYDLWQLIQQGPIERLNQSSIKIESTKEFPACRSALCGWCEYQEICPECNKNNSNC